MKMHTFNKNGSPVKLVSLIIIASALKIASTTTYCIEGKQYYHSDQKQCVPCKTCTSPKIVVATCQIYSNTVCGYPSLSAGPFLAVLQEDTGINKDFGNMHRDLQKKNNKSSKNDGVLQTFGQNQSNSKNRRINCRGRQNSRKTSWKKRCKQVKRKDKSSKLLKNTLFSSNLEKNNTVLYSAYQEQNKNGRRLENLTEFDVNYSRKIRPKSTSGAFNTEINFLFTDLGKVVVSSCIIVVNLMLILILLMKIFKACFQQKNRDTYCHSYKQKLPNPSDKPIKCRFTAVLPSKVSEYANVDSQSNPLMPPPIPPYPCSNNSIAHNSNYSCTAATLPHPSQREHFEARGSLASLPLPPVRGLPESEPLIASSEMLENANTIPLYSRMPPPNPFTMDRLLEHKRAIGCTSVENNLYVETWCNPPSTMHPPSRESSVAPSPALSSTRKPFFASNSSSPLTTRTFRATPAFTSFHPNRC